MPSTGTLQQHQARLQPNYHQLQHADASSGLLSKYIEPKKDRMQLPLHIIKVPLSGCTAQGHDLSNHMLHCRMPVS